MSEKPEALRLAEELTMNCHAGTQQLAAAELRRQHAEIERLQDELRQNSIDITRAKIERLQEALGLSERLAAGRLAMVEQLTDEVEALRRDAERDEAVKAEREACAKVCDGWASYGIPSSAAAAAAIRARGQEDKT